MVGPNDEENGHGGRPHPTSTGRPNRGLCKTCLDITKWFPVLFIVSVISWSYYAFVIQLCIITMRESWLQVIALTIYHIVLILFLWSYWQTIFSKSGRVPQNFKISARDLEIVELAQSETEVNEVLESIVIAHGLPVKTRTNIRQIRYCEKCSIIKPDRCHHCSVCGNCILKMDHHCPWVNNCVCFDNYKFFVLFLVYAFLYCCVIFTFALRYFIDFLRNSEWSGNGPSSGKFHVLFVFFVAFMFAFSLMLLFGYHCFLITKNRSTLESFRSPIFPNGPDKKGFSLGTYYNFIEIFGEDKMKWFIPIFTSLGDGIAFPTRHNIDGNPGNYNSIDTTDASTSVSPANDTDDLRTIREDKRNLVINNTDTPLSNYQNGYNNQQFQQHDQSIGGNRIAASALGGSKHTEEGATPLVYF